MTYIFRFSVINVGFFRKCLIKADHGVIADGDDVHGGQITAGLWTATTCTEARLRTAISLNLLL